MDAVDRPCYAFVESRLPRSLAAADSIAAAAAGHASAARFPKLVAADTADARLTA